MESAFLLAMTRAWSSRTRDEDDIEEGGGNDTDGASACPCAWRGATSTPGGGGGRAPGPRGRGSELSDDAAILSYEVSAERPDGEPYHAIVSSGYVRRDGEWKLAFHQHTPLDDRMN